MLNKNILSKLIVGMTKNKCFLKIKHKSGAVMIRELIKLWVLGFIYGFLKICESKAIVFLKVSRLELIKYLEKSKQCKR